MIALVLPTHSYVTPLQGLGLFSIQTQGVALGWYATPFQG